jgi:rhodanese-related sulfurtransferase
MMNFFNEMTSVMLDKDIKTMIKEGALLVDVRTELEFMNGHVPGSINIPLHTIPTQIDQFKGKNEIIVFCQSGGRSSQAKAYLDINGIQNVTNGGTWNYINQFI